MDLAAHLAELIQASNVPGHETGLARLLADRWSHLVDESRVDPIGSYVGLRRGRGPAPAGGRRLRVMAAAHLDSVGFLVSAVTDDGFLRVVTAGAPDRRCLPGIEVIVHGSSGPIPAVVGMVPPHLLAAAERKKAPDFHELWLDPGLPAAVLREQAPPGTPVTYRRPLTALLGDRCTGAYLDNRAGVAVLAVALEELARLGHQADLYAVGTAGEEFDMLGARSAAYRIAPDVSIAIDVTFGASPGADRDHFSLDGGPVILLAPDCHPGLARFLRHLARELEIPVGLEVAGQAGGTDAFATQVAGPGNVAGGIEVPLRYMHTPAETVSLADIRQAGRLLAHAVARIDEGQVAAWTSHS